MKRSGTCPKCRSTNLARDAKVVDRSEGHHEMEMKVAVFNRPDAFLFKGQQSSDVSAWVCTSCGFMEFYADSPAELIVDKR